jgi:hypothetical protein
MEANARQRGEGLCCGCPSTDWCLRQQNLFHHSLVTSILRSRCRQGWLLLRQRETLIHSVSSFLRPQVRGSSH